LALLQFKPLSNRKLINFTAPHIFLKYNLQQGLTLICFSGNKGNHKYFCYRSVCRLYDSQIDSIYFKGGLLDNTIIDLNNDGYLGIKFNGIAIFSGEKEDVKEEKK